MIGLCTAGCGPGGAGSEAGESGDVDSTNGDSDTGTDEADTGVEPPSGECSTAPGDHAASCPDAPCPIVVDVEITCDESRFGLTGVRVAADDDSTLAAMGGDNFAYVFGATGDGAITTSLLPEELAGTELHLAQASDGSVRLMADTTEFVSLGVYEGGIVMVTPDGDGWTTEDVWGSPEYTAEIVDFELVDDVPHAWFHSDPTDDVSHGVRGEDGTWDVAPTGLVAGGGGWQRYSLVDGVSIAHDMVDYGTGALSLASRIDEQTTLWGSSAVGRYYRQYRLPPRPLAGVTADPTTWYAAMAAPDGVRVVSGPGGVAAFDVPDSATPEPPCGVELQPPDCDMECDYEASGQADELRGFALAHTDDGTLWVALAVVHFDQHLSYAEECSSAEDGGECDCVASVEDEESNGEVRLYRVAADGTSGALVLTVPTGAPETSGFYSYGFAVDLRAWGDDLALGVNVLTQPGVIVSVGAHRLRLLRIDTALLPAD